MPPSRNNSVPSAPPETMIWGKAAPVLILAVVFDALRLFFEMFWFFGPAIAAAYCTLSVSGWVGSLWGLTASACGVGGVALGFFGAPAIAMFGVLMAMAVGLMGWMILWLILVMTNRRIITENAGNSLWFAGGLLISEVPFLGALPAFTSSLARMYSVQIKKEKAALKKYEEDHTAQVKQERDQQIAALMRARQEDAEQIQQQQLAANNEQYTQ